MRMSSENFIEKIPVDEIPGISEKEAEFFIKETQPFRADRNLDALQTNGEYNRELFSVVRDIESRLEKTPEFIGLSPFGSQTKGFSTEISDFDLYILLDAPSIYIKELDELLSDIKKEYAKKGIKVSFLKETIRSEGWGTPNVSVSEEAIESVDSMAALSRVATGRKIDIYRHLVREKIEKMHPLKKRAFFANIIGFLTEMDTIPRTLNKMEDIANENGNMNFDKESYGKARQELWTKRVHKIFGE